jgi:hypothetical protein
MLTENLKWGEVVQESRASLGPVDPTTRCECGEKSVNNNSISAATSLQKPSTPWIRDIWNVLTLLASRQVDRPKGRKVVVKAEGRSQVDARLELSQKYQSVLSPVPRFLT